MAVSNWVQKKVVNMTLSIEDEAGDHVLQHATSTPSATANFLYVDKTDFMNSEVIGEFKFVPASFLQRGSFVFRSDTALDNAYLASFYFNGALYIEKYDAGVRSTLLSTSSVALPAGTWYKFRIRCWDVVFPSNRVRFTFEQETAPGVWTLRWQTDDVTNFLLGITGRNGFGSFNPTSTASIRFNNFDLGHMV